jgi:magnesium transporter
MSLETLTFHHVTWVNIENATPQDIDVLRRKFRFHPLDLDDVLSKIERPKVDEYEDYLFIVMHFPVFDYERRISSPSEIDFFIGANFLVMVHDGRLKPLQALFASCKEDETFAQRHMGKGAGRLLYSILDRLVDYMFPILNKVSGHVREIEEDMFTEDMRGIVTRISLVRRDVIALRRILKPQMAIIANLENRERPFIQEELDVYFGDISDGFGKAMDIVEDYSDVIRGLSDTSNALTTYRINEVMRILAVISVVMLPLTLVSGIYGMNVPLPLAGSAWSFVFIVVLMLGIAGGMLAYFHRRGWL